METMTISSCFALFKKIFVLESYEFKHDAFQQAHNKVSLTALMQNKTKLQITLSTDQYVNTIPPLADQEFENFSKNFLKKTFFGNFINRKHNINAVSVTQTILMSI